MTEEVSESSPAKQRSSKKVIVLVAVAFIASVAYLFLTRDEPTPIPSPELQGVYDEVVEAIADAQQLVEEAPSSGATWGNYGMVLAAHEYIAEAIECFKEAARLSPQEMKWWYYLGDLHEFTDRKIAVACFQAAQELATHHKPLVNVRLAEMYLAVGQVEEARPLLQEAAKLEPTNDRVCLALARWAMADKKPSAALAYLNSAAMQYSRKAMLEFQAKVYRQLGNKQGEQKAVAAAQTATDDGRPDALLLDVQRCRVDPHWVAFQAKLAIQNGDIAGGRATLKLLIESNPEEASFRIELAQQLIALREFAQANVVLQQADETSFEILSLSGTVALFQERWEDAITAFQAAAMQKPTNARTQRDLAFAFEQASQLSAALETLNTATRLDSSESEFEVARIRILQKLNRASEVAQAIAQFKIRFPSIDIQAALEQSSQ